MATFAWSTVGVAVGSAAEGTPAGTPAGGWGTGRCWAGGWGTPAFTAGAFSAAAASVISVAACCWLATSRCSASLQAVNCAGSSPGGIGGGLVSRCSRGAAAEVLGVGSAVGAGAVSYTI
ncbi:hypothetical protein CGZ96_10320, partial [Enemella evansiae]